MGGGLDSLRAKLDVELQSSRLGSDPVREGRLALDLDRGALRGDIRLETSDDHFVSQLALRALTDTTLLPLKLIGVPTLEDMLLARHRAIDDALTAAIKNGSVGQVLEIACGLSPRGWRFTERHPDLVYVETEDYSVDPAKAGEFEHYIRRFWPGLPDGALTPDYAGIRPKLHGPGETQPDFQLRSTCGVLRLAKFERPVFGGRQGYPLRYGYRLGKAARVGITVWKGKRTIRTYETRRRAAGKTWRIRLDDAVGRRGRYRVTLDVRRGRSHVVATVVSRRL